MTSWDAEVYAGGRIVAKTRVSADEKEVAARALFNRYTRASIVHLFAPGALHPLEFTRADCLRTFSTHSASGPLTREQ
jgi:hypothetical protein